MFCLLKTVFYNGEEIHSGFPLRNLFKIQEITKKASIFFLTSMGIETEKRERNRN